MKYISAVISLIKKDLLVEMHNRELLYSVVIFPALFSLLADYFLSSKMHSYAENAVTMWIIIYLMLINTLPGIFSRERQNGNVIFIKLYSTYSVFFVSKFLFSIIISFCVMLTAIIIFAARDRIADENYYRLLILAMTASAAAASSTITVSMFLLSRRVNNFIYGIIVIPLTIPIIYTSILCTTTINSTSFFTGITFLLAFSVFFFCISFLLGEILWRNE